MSWAILKALKHNAFGADYIENILFQQMTPERNQQPVILKEEKFNRIHLNEPSLDDYDQFILKKRRKQ